MRYHDSGRQKHKKEYKDYIKSTLSIYRVTLKLVKMVYMFNFTVEPYQIKRSNPIFHKQHLIFSYNKNNAQTLFLWLYTLSRKNYDNLVRILANSRHEEFWYDRDINEDKAEEAMADDDAFLEILGGINKSIKG